MEERLLLDSGRPLSLTPKVFDLLVLFAENPGRLLEKDWLLTTLWPETFVEEANLSVNVSTLRRALGANGNLIETVSKRGYRFNATVQVDAAVPAIESGEELVGKPIFGKPQEQPLYETLVAPVPPSEPAPTKQNRRPHWPLLAATVLGLLALGYFTAGRNWFNGVQTLSDIHTLAVLPFRPLPGDTSAGNYLGPGMADALIRQMSAVQRIAVRSTASVQKYYGPTVDPIKAGRELGVDAVLDGTVQRADKMIRVSVELLRVADGATLWSAHFDDYFTNVFQVQDSIAEKVSSALSMKLTANEHRRMAKRQTENTQAFELYMQGKYFEFRRTADAAPEKKSIELY